MPADHASRGITTAQLFERAYTAVAAAPASTPTTPPMTERRIDSARNWAPFADKQGVTIESSGDVAPTTGSHALLLQMTTNLVHNAIVHNLPEQGSVWVTTSVCPDGVQLMVENTGETLTPQLVATLVEPFQRGTERVRTDHAGVGLGLAIVKSIAEAHDGTLTLAHRPAGGLRVTMQLPAAHPSADS